MPFILFMSIVAGFVGYGWSMFWAVFVAAIAIRVVPRLTGSEKISALEAQLAEANKRAEGLEETLRTKVERIQEEIQQEVERLHGKEGKLDTVRQRARKAGLQAAFDMYLDHRDIFDQNLRTVLGARIKAAAAAAAAEKAKERARQKALAEVKRPWWEVLDIPRSATAEEVKSAYRKLAMKLHPDVTGDNGERMAELNVAKDEAEAALT
jgi:predicted  nucleic acid-binding Zn-ribbon protein